MSIIIKIRSRELNFNNLNEDCNYELNQSNVISSINYIRWSLPDLKLLNKYSLINWSIYSTYDLSLEHFNEFGDFIDFDTYLTSIEAQYKNINSKIIDKISVITLKSHILKSHIAKNKSFYFEDAEFMKRFKSFFDAYNLEDVTKYITCGEILDEYINLLPLSFFDRILQRLELTDESCRSIISRFNCYIHEQEIITKKIFSTQNLSFDFIISNTWSYDVWIIILQSQSFEDDRLLLLLKKTHTMKSLISKHAKLNENFIIKYLDLLDIDIIVEFQDLSYEFVKSHQNLIKFELLAQNNKIKFTVLQTTIHSDLDDTIYIIARQPELKSVVFIDYPA